MLLHHMHEVEAELYMLNKVHLFFLTSLSSSELIMMPTAFAKFSSIPHNYSYLKDLFALIKMLFVITGSFGRNK